MQYQKDAKILYKAFDRYWEGKPKIDRLVFSITPDATVRYAKLQRTSAGDAVPQPADLARMRQDGNLQVMEKSGLNIGFGVQYQKKPLDNVKVRRALALAVNKPAIIEAVFHGAGQPARTCCADPVGSNAQSYRIRRSGRSSCCRKPGWGRGSTSICGRCRCSDYNQQHAHGGMIEADWAKIGVRAKIVTFEWGSIYSGLKTASTRRR